MQKLVSFKIWNVLAFVLMVLMGCQDKTTLSDDISKFSPNVLEFDRDFVLVEVSSNANTTASFELRLSGPNLDRLSESVAAIIDVNESLSSAVLGENFTFGEGSFVDVTANSKRFILTSDQKYVRVVNLKILALAKEKSPREFELTLEIKDVICEEFDCLVGVGKNSIRLVLRYE